MSPCSVQKFQLQEIIKDLANEHDQLATQVSQTLSPVQLLNVLRNLLDDGVPLLPRRILFEALLEGTLSGGSAANLAEQARFAIEELNAKPPVILTKAEYRRPLSQYLKSHNLAFHVVAFRELSGEFNFNPIGTIGTEFASRNTYLEAAE